MINLNKIKEENAARKEWNMRNIPPCYDEETIKTIDELIEEIERIRDYRVGTHSRDCWGFGVSHYYCALRKIKELESEISDLRGTIMEHKEER